MRIRIAASAVSVLLGAAAPATRADVLISNLSAAGGTGTAFGGTTATQYKAFGFIVGAQAFTLDSVVLSMNFGLGVPRVTICTGASAPATEVLVLDNPPVLNGQANFAFTAPSSFTMEAGETYWVRVAAEPVSGGPTFLWDGTSPSTVPMGTAATPVGYVLNGAPSAFRNRLEVNGTPETPCYPDCNDDGSLTVQDFGCFQTAFVAGNTYADCNADGNLTVQDFGCFQTSFVAGCP